MLESQLTEELACTSPGQFFCRLIDVIGDVQRRHPHIGCLVRIDRSDGFRGAFASELREYAASYIRHVFSRAFPRMAKDDLTRKLEVALSALLGALDALPPHDDSKRPKHLEETKVLVVLYADATFSLNKQIHPVGSQKRKKQ